MLFRITKKHWIAVLLSFVIALLYSLPWLAFGQQPRGGVNESMTTLRVVYLSVVVFSTSLLFFYTNFILVKILGKQRALIRTALYILIQSIVVLACTVLLVFIADVALEVRAVKAYFVFYLLRNLILAAIVGLLTYVVELVDKLEKERMEVLLLENKNTESELSALRSQIDPHFIFNTLSTLGGLISPANKNALVFLEHLSDTFRYIMEKRSNKLVSLKEELDFLRSYLYMMNCRFGDLITLTIRVDDAQSGLLPQFALQIAVENAIKHNRISPDYPLKIEIVKADRRLNVKNSVNMINSAGFGIGLANLSKRYVLSGDKDIEIRRTESYFELSLPLL